MHKIAEAAIAGSLILPLVEEFYGPNGPLAEAGWEIRPQQREMSLRIAAQIDKIYPPGRKGSGGIRSWGIAEAPCGTGKGGAYAIPGVLLSLRQKNEHAAAKALYEKEKAEYEERLSSGDDVTNIQPPTVPGPHAPQFVISTANIALQEQLVNKDIPAIGKMLGIDLSVALLKGRNNYVCKYRMRSITTDLVEDPKIKPIQDWIKTEGCTGDRERLPFDAADIWGKVSVTSEDCLGDSCAHFDVVRGDGSPCFWKLATREWKAAHVVVTNHAYLAMAAINVGLLAVDEMHELERALRGTQQKTLTDAAGRALASRVAKYIGDQEAENKVARQVRWLMEKCGAFYEKNKPPAYGNQKVEFESPVNLRPGWLHQDEYQPGIDCLDDVIQTIQNIAVRDYGCISTGEGLEAPRASKSDPEKSEEAAKICRVYEALMSVAERWLCIAAGAPIDTWPGSEYPYAIYLERTKTKAGGERVTASMVPGDVSWATQILAIRYPCAAFTSATIQEFSSLRLALGLQGEPKFGVDDAPIPDYEIRLPSPYPLEKMGVLLCPQGPSPKDQEWEDWAQLHVLDAVRAAGGGTLVLASSAKMMRKYTAILRDKHNYLGIPVKMQGEEGRGFLREWFRDCEDGVLVATRSFFQGLDIQGNACRQVIIDRIPFSRPDDPIEQAVIKLLEQRSGTTQGFMLRSVPEAAMVLAQGVGRLIRSQQDRGVILLLDGRIMQDSGGFKQIRDALPPFPVSRDVEDGARLLRGELLQGLPKPVQAMRAKRR